MKKDKDQQLIIEQLKKIPIVTIACEKIGISTSTYYRWREDTEFAKAADVAMQNGELYINDLSEAQVINLIREKSWSAIAFWLRSHHPRYTNRVEVQGRIEHTQARKRPMTPEEKAEYKKYLRIGLPATDDANPQKRLDAPEAASHDNHAPTKS
jgi:hypothetical protein